MKEKKTRGAPAAMKEKKKMGASAAMKEKKKRGASATIDNTGERILRRKRAKYLGPMTEMVFVLKTYQCTDRLVMDPNTPIKHLKDKIRNGYACGTGPGGFKIIALAVFNGQDILRRRGAEDEAPLYQCGFSRRTVLRVGFRGRFLVRFYCFGFEHLVEVDSTDTVAMLMQDVALRTGVAVEDQRLEAAETGETLSDPSRTLLSYNVFRVHPDRAIEGRIRWNNLPDIPLINFFPSPAAHETMAGRVKNVLCYSTILPAAVQNQPQQSATMIKLNVHTRYTPAQPLTVDIDSMCPISTLKLMMQDKYSLSNEPLLLVTDDGRDLFSGGDVDALTLRQCNVGDGANLTLGYKGRFFVSFKKRNGRRYYVEVDCHDTVEEMRQAIDNMAGSRGFLQIHFDGVELADPHRTLLSYGLIKNTIGVVIHDIRVHDQFPRQYIEGRRWI